MSQYINLSYTVQNYFHDDMPMNLKFLNPEMYIINSQILWLTIVFLIGIKFQLYFVICSGLRNYLVFSLFSVKFTLILVGKNNGEKIYRYIYQRVSSTQQKFGSKYCFKCATCKAVLSCFKRYEMKKTGETIKMTKINTICVKY